MVNEALEASEQIGKNKVKVFDTGTTSLGLGFMAIKAAMWAKENLSREEIVQRLENLKKRTYIVASLNTIEYARRGGRISHLKGLAGSVLGLKPIIQIYDNFLSDKDHFIRTRSKSLKRLVEITKTFSPLEMVGVVHADAEDEAEQVANEISGFFKGKILLTNLGSALTAHAGPKAIGIAFVRQETI
jgi:DegV family protein with EDD domain